VTFPAHREKPPGNTLQLMIGNLLMAIYLFWGEDDFAMQQAIKALRDRTLDPDWASFNSDKLPPDQPDAVMQALTLAMTPPFGAGQRFVWLADTGICQRCPDEVLQELERSLPVIPDATVLLLTSSGKPDSRIKAMKLLKQHAEIREFEVIPPWKTDLLERQVQQTAQSMGLTLTKGATEQLAEAVGNQSRLLHNELEKLSLFCGSKPIDEAAIAALVTSHSQNSLKLAAAIRQGQSDRALSILSELLGNNEPALRIVATLVGQFRTWLWIKLMTEARERDEAIAKAAEISNPKRIYFLKQEVAGVSLVGLERSLSILLELEYGLKLGADPLMLCQVKLIELCGELCGAIAPGRR
jgi:DNA polymerase III subunit delta